MSKTKYKLPLKGSIDLIRQLSNDFHSHVKAAKAAPEKITYVVKIAEESPSVIRSARKVALESMKPSFVKVAFDTRRIDQNESRNPRANLQYWHRSSAFIDDADQIRIDAYSKLFDVLTSLKNSYGTRPDWHNSYARILHDSVSRVLRIKLADNEISHSQLNYLEQLLFARYRVTLEDITKLSNEVLKHKILSKDESLLSRGVIYKDSTDEKQNNINVLAEAISKSGVKDPQQNVINVYPAEAPKDTSSKEVFSSLFGANLRKDGEREVERTITITIRDNVIE